MARTEVAYRPVPRLDGSPVLGSMAELRRDYLGTISRAASEIGGLARISAGPPGWRMTVYCVSSPELAGEILGDPGRFRQDAPGYRELRQALGNNMLTSEDEVWRRQRRFLAPMFTPRRISGAYADVMTDEADQLVRRWRDAAAADRTVDAYGEMIQVTSRVIGRILFGADVSRAVPQLARFARINDQLLRRSVSPHPVPRGWPTPGNRRLTYELREIRKVVDAIIAERQAGPAHRSDVDLLGMLLTARDAENAADRLSDVEVADQVLIFLLAGLETTAVTLACTLVQLALAPTWQETVRTELAEQLSGRSPSVGDVGRLTWTGHVIRESMRLYPAAHGMARSNRHDEVLDGYRVPAGSWLEVSPWGIHHSPAVWEEPETFDPRRFDLPAGQWPGGHRYAWIPFGAGARSCVGMQIAMLEMQIVLGALLQHLELETPLTRVPVHAAITLQPSGALPLRLRRRA